MARPPGLPQRRTGSDDLTLGARRIAHALAGPAGHIGLARVVMKELEWFDRAQARGLTWDQVIAVLHAAGAGRQSGLPFSRGHVSSCVWRARKKFQLSAKKEVSAASLTSAGPDPNPEQDGWRTELTSPKGVDRRRAMQGHARCDGEITPGHQPPTRGEPKRPVLDFMRRAVATRWRAKEVD